MRFLPLGLDVRDRPCLVAGGGEVGARKVRNLLEAGARVTLVAPRAVPELVALEASGKIRWLQEEFRPAHLHGVLLAVAATDREGVNLLLVEEARRRGVLVCDASSRERTQVIFGALHRGEHTTVAVFTDGQDPSRARKTRDRIARLLEPMGEFSDPFERRGTGMLILLAHGSRDAQWRGSLEALTERVRESLAPEEVEVAFMQFAGPTLQEVLSGGMARGIRSYRLLPLFMASAGHVDKDIRPMVDDLARTHPHVRLELLTPVGENPLFPELLARIANHPREGS